MKKPYQWLHSLKTRIGVGVLLVFVTSLWATLQYINHTLSSDLKDLLEAQQFSTANIVATQINRELRERLDAIKMYADMATGPMRSGPAAIQAFVEQNPILLSLFNGGLIVQDADGTAIADIPASTGRLGVNYMNSEVVAVALKEGRASIGNPVMGKKLKRPVFGIAAPIHDPQGRVVGVLDGVINLGLPNFLDQIAANGYAKTGGYLLVNPHQRQIVAATDKQRIMEILPAPGNNPGIDWAINGNEGTRVILNRYGVEQLVSVKKIPVTGWILAITLPTQEAFAPVRGMQQRLLLIGLLMTALVAALIGLILKHQLAPMGAAAVALSNMLTHPQNLRPLPVLRHDEVGQLVGGFNQMIAAVSQREADLRSVQAELKGTLNAIPDLLFECDAEYRIVGYRARSTDLLVAPAEQFLGRSVRDVLPREAADACEAAMQQTLQDGYSAGHQYPLALGGDVKWFELSVALKPQLGDTSAHFVLLARDITEKQRARLAMQQSRDELRALANRLQSAREAQRAHLAREIHDVLAQELTRIKIDLSWMKRRLEAPVPESVRENLLVRAGQAMALEDSSITTVQRIATELRPVILDSLGLFAALEWQVEDFSKRTGLKCSAQVAQQQEPPSREVSIVLFRILQESLTNIARHAHATVVQVQLKRESADWVLTVQDNGVGITQAQIAAAQSLGLLGMVERALAIRGTVQFDGDPLTGTRITARVPAAGANA